MIPKLNISGSKFQFTRICYQKLIIWYRDQVDLLPPYGNYQGILLGKFIENDKHYIDLEVDRVEVDKVTFSILEEGENIKVRYTRVGKRAINIDRYFDEPSFHGNE